VAVTSHWKIASFASSVTAMWWSCMLRRLSKCASWSSISLSDWPLLQSRSGFSNPDGKELFLASAMLRWLFLSSRICVSRRFRSLSKWLFLSYSTRCNGVSRRFTCLIKIIVHFIKYFISNSQVTIAPVLEIVHRWSATQAPSTRTPSKRTARFVPQVISAPVGVLCFLNHVQLVLCALHLGSPIL